MMLVKCIKFRLLSKRCVVGTIWETQQEIFEYEKVVNEHDCPINHSKSAWSVEASSVVVCF